jgi:hypothetical protein
MLDQRAEVDLRGSAVTAFDAYSTVVQWLDIVNPASLLRALIQRLRSSLIVPSEGYQDDRTIAVTYGRLTVSCIDEHLVTVDREQGHVISVETNDYIKTAQTIQRHAYGKR